MGTRVKIQSSKQSIPCLGAILNRKKKRLPPVQGRVGGSREVSFISAGSDSIFNNLDNFCSNSEPTFCINFFKKILD